MKAGYQKQEELEGQVKKMASEIEELKAAIESLNRSNDVEDKETDNPSGLAKD